MVLVTLLLAAACASAPSTRTVDTGAQDAVLSPILQRSDARLS